MKKSRKNSDTILIVGDWVVDEYWFLVRHYSEISSHTGFIHYRISSQPQDIVSDLCGAGHVARVLHQLRNRDGSSYGLIGLGNWSQRDTKLIKHLIHSREEGVFCGASTASFQLTPTFCNKPPKLKLIPLRKGSPTIRVIRQYHQEDGGLYQLNRVDWEPQLSPSDSDPHTISWEKLGLPPSSKVGSLVIHDFRKGVVNEGVIRQLKERYPDAKWYVRSKQRNPKWLKIIGDSLELTVLGPEVAALLAPWENWLINGKITSQALDALEGLPGKNTILLSDKREIIARLGKKNHCITAQSHIKSTPISQLGWPSAVIASLIHLACKKKSSIGQKEIRKALRWADGLCGVPSAGSTILETRLDEDLTIRKSSWAQEKVEWRDAAEGCGIIFHEKKKDKSKQLCLDVWRGSTHLPGYIACISEKQKILNRIGRHLRAFERGETQTRSTSIMLQADPGAGKTHLAKSLAKAFGFSFIRYDVTQMIHRDDLLDLFDTVATTQANMGEKILVFIDEINALLDASHVYGAFLAPLEEGFYVRHGNIFTLKPCVWIFAGTEFDEDKLEAGEKLRDFKSRMTLIERIDYASLKPKYTADTAKLQTEARLEQVYLGATMIKKNYPDVDEVSKEVLEQFRRLDPEKAPARKIHRLVVSLRNVQYGRVTRRNCGNWDVKEWEGIEDGDKLVKVVFA